MQGVEEAKRQRQQLDRYLKWFSEEGGSEGPTHLSTWFKPHQQYRLKWLKKHCLGMVMELGCNYGYVLAYCGGHIGVDWNENNVALARILNPGKEFVVADIRALPFPNAYVDTVLLADCLEHLPWEDVERAVSEAKRVARQRVLVTVPDGWQDEPDACCFKHRWLLDEEKADELMTMLKEGAYATLQYLGGFALIACHLA